MNRKLFTKVLCALLFCSFLFTGTKLSAQPALKSFVVVYKSMSSVTQLDSVTFFYSGGRTYTVDDVFNDNTTTDGEFMFNRPDYMSAPFDSAHIKVFGGFITFIKWYNSGNQLIKSCVAGSTDTTIYLYNSSGKPLAIYHQSAKDTFIYSGSNLVKHLLYTYSSAWTLAEKRVFVYDVNNDVVFYADTNWSGGGAMIAASYYYNYNSNHQPLSVNERHWGMPTVDSFRTLYHYNSSNQCDTATGTFWQGAMWNPNFVKIYTYTAGKRTKCITLIGTFMQKGELVPQSFSMSETNIMWMNSNSTGWNNTLGRDTFYRLYYDVPSAIQNTPVAKNISCTIYPVPASSYIDIALTQKDEQPLSITIFSMNGQLITKWEETAQKTLNKRVPVDGLPSGQYVLYINNRKEEMYKQFTISK